MVMELIRIENILKGMLFRCISLIIIMMGRIFGNILISFNFRWFISNIIIKLIIISVIIYVLVVEWIIELSVFLSKGISLVMVIW